MTEKTYLTIEGLENLKKELDELKNVKRPEIIQALKDARAQGDLSENAEYDAARTSQAETEAKIQLIGFSILFALFIFVTYNDILRIGGRFLI